ncbi:MAG TPA: HipA family kinase [Cyclobacteriaceae bacterium]|nr:HipA family kinase [Cyclobacteriaceae bacterium]
MTVTTEFRTVNVTRYVTPLREGGSLPAIVEADDGFLYVLKFRGAGQGAKALIAEIIGGEIARSLGLKVPELVLANLDEAFGRIEGDEEIQDLLKASTGLNLGVHYLSGAITFDPLVTKVSPLLASQIVWLDAFLMNVDRTPKNANMLWWNKELWLIDHGASLYFHHAWPDTDPGLKKFPQIKDHILLSHASELDAVRDEAARLLTPARINDIVALIPTQWLAGDPYFHDAAQAADAYRNFLVSRVKHADQFTNEAIHARQALI